MRIQRLTLSDEKPIQEAIDLEKESVVDLQKIEPLLKKYKNKAGNLIPVLQGVQNEFGYIPREAFLKINQ